MNKLQERINEKYPNEDITVLEYTIMKEPAKVKCNNCKTEYLMKKGEAFVRKDKKCICRRCVNDHSGGRRTKEQFARQIDRKYPQEDLTVLSFTTGREPGEIKCNVCGEIYKLKHADSFLIPEKERVCKVCLPNKRRFLEASKENFKKFIKESQDFILRQDVDKTITGSHDLIECECVYCHEINRKTIYKYMKGTKCSCQGGNLNLTTEQIQQEMPEGFIVLESNGARGKMLIRHEECGFIFSRTRQHRRKVFCPKCDSQASHGERIILKWLEDNDIEYIQEYPVKIKEHNLRFDFYLPQQDIYIEYQGVQHYKPVRYFGGEEKLERQQKYDNLKRDYCGDKLLEISYTEPFENIPTILANKIFVKFND